jgi:hypothetical protein
VIACARKNKEMKDSSGLCSHGMPTRLSPWRKEHGSKAAWRAAKQLRDTRSDPCRSARLCESIRAADGTEVTESARNTSRFP